jgi:hypothetical protein
MWNFTNAAGLIYTGTLTYGSVTGAQGYASAPPNPGSGSFYMTRVSTSPAPAGAIAAGASEPVRDPLIRSVEQYPDDQSRLADAVLGG